MRNLPTSQASFSRAVFVEMESASLLQHQPRTPRPTRSQGSVNTAATSYPLSRVGVSRDGAKAPSEVMLCAQEPIVTRPKTRSWLQVLRKCGYVAAGSLIGGPCFIRRGPSRLSWALVLLSPRHATFHIQLSIASPNDKKKHQHHEERILCRHVILGISNAVACQIN